MKQSDPQLKLRLPPDLVEKLRASAEELRRPISSEIVDRLERSFSPGNLKIYKQGDPKPIDQLTGRVAVLEARLAEMSHAITKLARK